MASKHEMNIDSSLCFSNRLPLWLSMHVTLWSPKLTKKKKPHHCTSYIHRNIMWNLYLKLFVQDSISWFLITFQIVQHIILSIFCMSGTLQGAWNTSRQHCFNVIMRCLILSPLMTISNHYQKWHLTQVIP